MIAYFDMFSGVSGDMFLGSLLDAGLDRQALLRTLAGLGIPDFDLRVRRVRRGPLEATHAEWLFEDSAQHRALADIEALIRDAGFAVRARERSLAIFRRLADVEARVHGIPTAQVRFHEVGALDAILDVCGAACALELLGVDRVEASPFRTGSGYVETAHGPLPVPPPAVAALVEGWRLEPLELSSELTTPTGAAIVTTLATPPGGPARLVVRRTGYGAGTRDRAGLPNCLRVLLGDPAPETPTGGESEAGLVLLETNVDDMNPQLYGWLEEKLFAAGARDVSLVAVAMKKGRPGTLVRCLADAALAEPLADVLLAESTTLGVRWWPVQRRALERSEETVETSVGPLRVKRVRRLDGREELRPEYEDCRRVAAEQGLALRDVFERLGGELRTVARGSENT